MRYVSSYFLSALGVAGVPPSACPSCLRGGVTRRVIGQFIAGPHRRQPTISSFADVHLEEISRWKERCRLTSVVPQQKRGPHGGAKGMIKSQPQMARIDPSATVSAVCITIDPAAVSTGCHTDPKWTFTSTRNLQRRSKPTRAHRLPCAGFYFSPAGESTKSIHQRSDSANARVAQEASGLCPFVASLPASSVRVSLRLCLLTPLSTPALPSILEPLLHPDSESVCHGGQ